MQIDDGSGNGGKCQLQIFKDTILVLTIGDVSTDYHCHQYSNLTYPRYRAARLLIFYASLYFIFYLRLIPLRASPVLAL